MITLLARAALRPIRRPRRARPNRRCQRLQGDGSAHRRRARRRDRNRCRRAPAPRRGWNGRSRTRKPGSRVPPELQRHQCQQHGLAGASRTDDQRVADIADMRKAEGRRPRSRRRSRWASRCSSRAGPAQTAESGIMCARFSVTADGAHWRGNGRAGCRTRRRPR